VQILVPLAACYGTKLLASVTSDIVGAMAEALAMVEHSLPPIDSLEPPKPPPSKPEAAAATDGDGDPTSGGPTEGAAADAEDTAGQGAAETEAADGAGETADLTEEQLEIAKKAMEKATAAAGVSLPTEEPPAAPPPPPSPAADATVADSKGAEEDETTMEEPSQYALVDLPLVAEMTTTIAALQHRLYEPAGQQQAGMAAAGSWLWQAVSGAPQLQAHSALRSAMIAPTTPTADPLLCMAEMLCQTWATATQHDGSSNGASAAHAAATFGAGAVLGVISRPAAAVVAGDSDDDALLSTAYLRDSLPSDGLVAMPQMPEGGGGGGGGELAGGMEATNWQLTVSCECVLLWLAGRTERDRDRQREREDSHTSFS
jgi:hypothetical protein